MCSVCVSVCMNIAILTAVDQVVLRMHSVCLGNFWAVVGVVGMASKPPNGLGLPLGTSRRRPT